MRLKFRFILILFWTLAAAAQDPQTAPPAAPPAPPPAVLENTGKPILLPFRCSEDDIQWAGLTCTEDEPCPVFLELTAAEQTGSRVLTAGNIHTASVTLYSVLLASDDNGRTWTEAHPRLRGAGLDRIQFFDPEDGWIPGQELFPIPQNPFLLVTHDGGKTWRQHIVFDENSENRFGAISQFALSGKKDGSLVIDRGRGSIEDRYVLFETPDGGDTWAIKQESANPLTLKNAAAPRNEWRIRTDAASKAFHVERREGARWVSIAAFLVKLEPCKPTQ
jgi:photosystem II stability/assembly factor-like uncharacterized protein